MAKVGGRNLSATIGGTAVPCPQSYSINESPRYLEYFCVGVDGDQRIYDGSNWTASVTYFPDNDDYAELAAWSEVDTAVAILIYPDGATAGNTRISFNAFPAISNQGGQGSLNSITVNLQVDGSVTFDAVPS